MRMLKLDINNKKNYTDLNMRHIKAIRSPEKCKQDRE